MAPPHCVGVLYRFPGGPFCLRAIGGSRRTVEPMATISNRISALELRRLLDGPGPVDVVDVRTPGEFASVHIPGSQNIPLADIHNGSIGTRGAPVVLVCASGDRAGRACQLLAGDVPAQVLDGGVAGWLDAGGAVERGPQRWGLERQVRLVAGGIVLGATVASVMWPKARFVAGAVGAGLVFAAVSNTCAMANVLARLPYNRPPSNTCQ